MTEEDHRIVWVRDKVCTALGLSEELFNQAGQGSHGNTVADLQGLLDSSKTGGAIFYCLAHLDEVEVDGKFMIFWESGGAQRMWRRIPIESYP